MSERRTMKYRNIAAFAFGLSILGGLRAQSLEQAQTRVNDLAQSEGKKALDLNACFSSALYPGGLGNLAWRGNSPNLAYVNYSDKIKNLKTRDARSGSESVLLPIDSFFSWFQMPYFPAFHWLNENEVWFQSKTGIEFLNIQTQAKEAGIRIPAGTQALEITDNGRSVAYVLDDQLYLNDQILTTDGGHGIVYGQSVHRNEFGIEKGLFWSPSGHRLAFYRMDEGRVSPYPLVDLNERPAKHQSIPYPMAGDSSHTVSIGIAQTGSSKVVYLQTEGPYDQYLTNITWSPDEKSVYVFALNRGQDTCALKQYDSETGALITTLFTQTSPRYVEPEHGLHFLPGSQTDFLFFSEYSGYNHLWLYSSKGKTELTPSPVGFNLTLHGKGAVRPLTQGNWEVLDFLGFASGASSSSIQANAMLYTSTQRSPLNVDVYAWNWGSKGSKPVLLTQFQGVHSVSPASCNFAQSMFVDMFSSTNTPRSYLVQAINWKESATVQTPLLVFEAANPLQEYSLARMEMSQLENEGNILYTRTFYPSDFDPSKKYPVVCYLYGGPHAQMIQNRWLGGANLWFHYMAQAGYIVYTVDNRGSSHRGLAFEQATFRNLGLVEMNDQLAVLRHFKSLPYVDSNRCGVHGWSFGGFMTTSLMTRQAGAFQVGVAGGPVIDWNYYEIMYTERYMDRPQENPDGYAANSLLNHANKLAGRLLMIHGTLDNVVLWQHSQLFVEKCVQSGVTGLDYFIYPGHEHNVMGRDRAHLYKKVSQYFFEHL